MRVAMEDGGDVVGADSLPELREVFLRPVIFRAEGMQVKAHDHRPAGVADPGFEILFERLVIESEGIAVFHAACDLR